MLPEIDSWESRKQVLRGAEDWEFSGRIGVKTADDGFNGKLRWAQDGDRFAAAVGGPLGIGTVRIAGDGRNAVLTDKDGECTELRDVEADLLYRYGWTIPVASLRYWALGIPDPEVPPTTMELDANGRLARLVQRDWELAITRYRDGAGQSLPYRFSATNADTRVRIVVDEWRFYE